MLSILIPIYNFNANNLVQDILAQCVHASVDFEIIIIDDASSSLTPIEVSHDCIVYQTELKNLGRAAVRNKLAALAKHEWLLFIDGDSGVVSTDYIKAYLSLLPHHTFIYGGTLYEPNRNDINHNFHHTYGVQREALSANERSKNAHLTFKTNNFLIEKALFNKIRFDEAITGYGYEDTLFALKGAELGISILHIENPVSHLGLNTNIDFIHKTKAAMLTLSILHKEGKIKTKITKIFQKLAPLLHPSLINFLEKKIYYKLTKASNLNLTLFDLWKLLCLAKFSQGK
jgi:glycosyltransferase involved in cell wall biosynthesis